MSKKENKISFHKIDGILSNYKEESKAVTCYTSEGEEVVITVKPYLSVQEMAQFVSDVADNVFDGETYAPYNRAIATVYAVLFYFTNLKSDMGLERLAAFERTPVYAEILEKIDLKQFSFINSSISEFIEYRKRENQNTQKERLEKNINELQAMTDVFVKLGEQFKEFDAGRMMNAIEEFAKKDEATLANSILDYKEKQEKAALDREDSPEIKERVHPEEHHSGQSDEQ